MGKKPGKPKKAAPKSAPKGKSLKRMGAFAKALLLTLGAGLALLVLFRYRVLDAWQWSDPRAPSIYLAVAVGVALASLSVASWRGGKPAFWGATFAVLAGLAGALAFPL